MEKLTEKEWNRTLQANAFLQVIGLKTNLSTEKESTQIKLGTRVNGRMESLTVKEKWFGLMMTNNSKVISLQENHVEEE